MAGNWKFKLTDKGRKYRATARHRKDIEAWDVRLKVDGKFINAIQTENPTGIALQIIADAQLLEEETEPAVSQSKWKIKFTDDEHSYSTIATYLTGPEAWNVIMKVDGLAINSRPSDDPTADALEMIAEAVDPPEPPRHLAEALERTVRRNKGPRRAA